METFEPDTKCCWTSHSFRANEQGMKCLSCKKVITNDALEERRREGRQLCYCTSPNLVNLVSAVARFPSNPTRLQADGTQSSPTTPVSNNPRPI